MQSVCIYSGVVHVSFRNRLFVLCISCENEYFKMFFTRNSLFTGGNSKYTLGLGYNIYGVGKRKKSVSFKHLIIEGVTRNIFDLRGLVVGNIYFECNQTESTNK